MMTDKVQKIREEVERLKRWNNNVRNSTRHMTLQEEDFNRGKHSSYLEILNFIDSMQEEPVSEGLEEAIDTYLATYFGGEKEKQEWPFLKKMVIYFTKWQKEQMMGKAKSGTVQKDNQIILDNGTYIDLDPSMQLKPSFVGLKEGDRIKVIIIKED